jgi:hypothetical protein
MTAKRCGKIWGEGGGNDKAERSWRGAEGQCA